MNDETPLFSDPAQTARRQFYDTRANPDNGGVIVHTTEGGSTVRWLGDLIRTRTDAAGSYAEGVDFDLNWQRYCPDEWTSFSVATPGFNSRTWSIAIVGRSADLNPDDPRTRAVINRVGQRIVAHWRRTGRDPRAGARWIGPRTQYEQGLANHGDVQPSDRSDAWARHPRRAELDQLLVDAIHRAANGEEDDMPLTDQDVDKVAARVRDFLVNPQTAQSGVVIDEGARNTLSAIETGVLDPVGGLRAMVAGLSRGQGSDPAAIADAVLDALGDDLAGQVVAKLAEKLAG